MQDKNQPKRAIQRTITLLDDPSGFPYDLYGVLRGSRVLRSRSEAHQETCGVAYGHVQVKCISVASAGADRRQFSGYRRVDYFRWHSFGCDNHNHIGGKG